MTLRIAHIISAGEVDGRAVPEAAVSPGFEVDIVESVSVRVPNDSVDLMIKEVCTVEAAMRAQRLGYDGVLIGAVADYGIDAIRSALRIPVVGCGEASMLTAAGLCERFGIVTIWPPSSAPLYRSVLARSGLTGRCASVRHVTADAEMATLADSDNFYTQMRAGRQNMLTRINAEIIRAAGDGAEVVVLGCNCMTPVAAVLAAAAEVPIVDPTTTGYKYLEMLLSLGLTHSAAAYPPAATDRSALFGDLVRALGEALEEDAECQVCTLSHDGGEPDCSAEEPALAGD